MGPSGRAGDTEVTGLPSDYGPLQIDIVGPGPGTECDQRRGQESHVTQFRSQVEAKTSFNTYF